MKRHQTYFAALIIFVMMWLSVLGYSHLYDITKLKYFSLVLPWLILMWLGCYCLARLGIDLLSFNDYPLEIQKLAKVINEYLIIGVHDDNHIF